MLGVLTTNFTVRLRHLLLALFIHFQFFVHHLPPQLVGMCNAVKVIATQNPKEAIDSSFGILLQCNEVLPRTMGDEKLRSDIDQMNFILKSISDHAILNMKQNNGKKTNTIINLYANLTHFMQYFKPWQLGSICLRMVELTINSGMCAKSSVAFAYFGGVLVSIGYVNEGRRLGEQFFRFSIILRNSDLHQIAGCTTLRLRH